MCPVTHNDNKNDKFKLGNPAQVGTAPAYVASVKTITRLYPIPKAKTYEQKNSIRSTWVMEAPKTGNIYMQKLEKTC